MPIVALQLSNDGTYASSLSSPRLTLLTSPPPSQEILRAEIESVRSGTDSTDRVKSLESQITDLESECARLSQALDLQKSTALEAEQLAKRKADEASKEIAGQAAEIEGLRQKLRKYADYDEVKRELEIMKVGFGSFAFSLSC